LRASAGGIVKQLLSAVTLFLTSFWACAAAGEMNEVASAPAELVDVTFVVLFFIFFIGMIAWFFVHMWRNEKKRQPGR
jgi:heme/copper-type cytochrome/quinol oxidase subunit 2